MATIIIEGNYTLVREVLFGRDDHDAHVRDYRWHLRVVDAEERACYVAAEVDAMNRRYRETLDMARAMGRSMKWTPTAS